MTDTINNQIPFVPENTIDPAAGLNLSLNTIDALLQVLVQSVGENTPPAGVEGQRHVVGTSPTGAWVGQANKLARFLDGAWQFFDARYALNAADGRLYLRSGATWASLDLDGDISSAIAAHIAAPDPHTQYQLKTFDNLTATADPTVSDDSADGYQLLSRWLNTVTREFWICLSPAIGAAVWQKTTLTIDELSAIAVSGAAVNASIADVGGYYMSTEVEGALQEVGVQIGDIAAALDAINGEVIP